MCCEVEARAAPTLQNTAITESKTSFTYKRVGNTDIKADVYRSPGLGTRPVILWIHGGALIFGSRSMLPADELAQFLQAGFVVVAIDYRLAPETKLPEILEDVDDAIDWVRTKGPSLFRADPSHVAVVGQSAGAYLAIMEGIRARPRVQAVVSFYGYGNISGDWYSNPDAFFLKQRRITQEEAFQVVGSTVLSESAPEPRSTFYVYCRQTGLWPEQVGGIDPHLNPKEFAPYNPENLVTPSYPSTFLLHGDRDTDVPFQMSERMAASLKRQGVNYRFYRMRGFNHLFDVFPDGPPPQGHAIGLRNPQVRTAFDEVILFLKDQVGSGTEGFRSKTER
jgi:acetyl esterase/lipase